MEISRVQAGTTRKLQRDTGRVEAQRRCGCSPRCGMPPVGRPSVPAWATSSSTRAQNCSLAGDRPHLSVDCLQPACLGVRPGHLVLPEIICFSDKPSPFLYSLGSVPDVPDIAVLIRFLFLTYFISFNLCLGFPGSSRAPGALDPVQQLPKAPLLVLGPSPEAHSPGRIFDLSWSLGSPVSEGVASPLTQSGPHRAGHTW